jgi:hypothetical protein
MVLGQRWHDFSPRAELMQFSMRQRGTETTASASATPDRLADLMVASLARPPSYRPVESGGAERAAQLVAEVFA